jgi:transposase
MARDRYDNNDDDSDVTTAVRPRRVEVLIGPERRRRWPDEVKIAIVAEALVKGVVVSEVARRHDIAPSQLFGWMRRLRPDAEAVSASVASPTFAPVALDVAPVILPAPTLPPERPVAIEISVGIATVRIRGAVDTRSLAAVLKVLKVLA